MSKNTSHERSKPVGLPPHVACRGYCGHQYEAARSQVDAAHPEWTRTRRNQRAWIEMFKSGAGRAVGAAGMKDLRMNRQAANDDSYKLPPAKAWEPKPSLWERAAFWFGRFFT